MNRQTWTRVLGLSTRALSLTAQRMLDVWSITNCFMADEEGRARNAHDGTILAVGLLLTTVLMALTMQKHWSGLRRQGRPHGLCLAVTSSVLQIAPLVEMIDKVLSHQMPICFAGDRLGPQRTPLLRSTVAKGSPGENAMRGVRKLSMVNMPQAGLSLWYHIGRLVPQSAHLVPPQHPTKLTVAFIASFFSLSFGIADFVLYVWVDDAFVRENKKLVTFHYCVEILMRLPMLVLFHLCGKEKYGSLPILVLFCVDVLTTTLLLSWARFSQSRRKCFCLPAGTRHGLAQCVFSIVISIPLFFVNLVYCDPGMSFFYVNQVYYIIKYCELIGMWAFIRFMRDQQRKSPVDDEGWETSVLDLPNCFYEAFKYAIILFVVLNAMFVWWLVPSRRRKKDERLLQGSETSFTRMATDPVEAAIASSPEKPGTSGRGGSLLGSLEGIFELLYMLSATRVAGNRHMILDCIVENLWYEALPWNGTFDDGAGGVAHVAVSLRERVVLIRQHGLQRGSLEGGALVVPGPAADRRGRFDGRRIRWDDGSEWTKRADLSGEDSAAVLKLILPQLALALQWDFAGEAARSLCDAEAGVEAQCKRPLLSFLVGYAFVTKQADIISDLYWALVCLAQEEEEQAARDKRGAAHGFGYCDARATLLRVVHGELPSLLPDCGSPEDLACFLQLVRRMLRGQREVWQQNMELIMNHSGRASGGTGSWTHKTEAVRDALRRWRELRKKSGARIPDADEELLRSPRVLVPGSLDDEAASRQESPMRLVIDTDMVSPEDGDHSLIMSLPIDPTVQFRGIVIDETEVIPSKQAPLLLTCRTRGIQSRLIQGYSPVQSPRHSDSGANDEVQEKYLLKVGDDLRQDQLMLQMMALMSCAWQERLPPEEARLLQIANFRALAVTPQAGYVKFVADSVALSDALHDSHGNLVAWLETHRLEGLSLDEVLDNFSGSVAACCVVTYILGIGDRHLENLCISRRGQLFHVDFGFILGDDPKPMAPPVRLPQQVAQALMMTDRLSRCFTLAGRAYLELRPLAGLWTSILKLIAATGVSGCPRLAREPSSAISGLRERLRVDQQDEERAASEFLCLMRESSEGMASVLIDKVHAAGLFWR